MKKPSDRTTNLAFGRVHHMLRCFTVHISDVVCLLCPVLLWPPCRCCCIWFVSCRLTKFPSIHRTKKTLSSLPLLTVNAGPRDEKWKDRLKVLSTALHTNKISNRKTHRKSSQVCIFTLHNSILTGRVHGPDQVYSAWQGERHRLVQNRIKQGGSSITASQPRTRISAAAIWPPHCSVSPDGAGIHRPSSYINQNLSVERYGIRAQRGQDCPASLHSPRKQKASQQRSCELAARAQGLDVCEQSTQIRLCGPIRSNEFKQGDQAPIRLNEFKQGDQAPKAAAADAAAAAAAAAAAPFSLRTHVRRENTTPSRARECARARIHGRACTRSRARARRGRCGRARCGTSTR